MRIDIEKTTREQPKKQTKQVKEVPKAPETVKVVQKRVPVQLPTESDQTIETENS